MTDQPPIVVNATPLKDQIESGLRQAVTVLGPLVAMLAASGWGEKVGLNVYFTAFVGSIGLISTVAAIILGQLKTRSMAQKAVVMATQLPDTTAVIKA